jgi:hypothetical protein
MLVEPVEDDGEDPLLVFEPEVELELHAEMAIVAAADRQANATSRCLAGLRNSPLLRPPPRGGQRRLEFTVGSVVYKAHPPS